MLGRVSIFGGISEQKPEPVEYDMDFSEFEEYLVEPEIIEEPDEPIIDEPEEDEPEQYSIADALPNLCRYLREMDARETEKRDDSSGLAA